ncbi:hypothetical protein FGG08_006775 [Glutinoglossum americanum]|uniref:gamma-glutamylcyclotransferase n=1 Tax=Glutinoglossum americanum TaxID=1670608 RepID=A0A9P8KUM4_9PEZI|nr:hypothetical protein FGG08_006775 [Glutinoglossum americanum]
MSQTHILPGDTPGHRAVQGTTNVSPATTRAIETQNQHLPAISDEKRSRSVGEEAFTESFVDDIANQETAEHDTVLYLAYGSNLCEAKFRDVRGIKPLAQLNVLVPELVLMFDLPGIPYTEPCFANVQYRDQKRTRHSNVQSGLGEKLLSNNEGRPPKYHKDRWKKGLVGVVYEVTKKDYATIIVTEGGGSAYKDVVVTCYPLPEGNAVPENPQTSPFQAHTLFSPRPSEPPPGKTAPKRAGRAHRPDPSYAQPSARYLRLLTDGADEHDLPEEYRLYLRDIRPYTVTTNRQRFGQFLFMSVWIPVVYVLIFMQRIFGDKRGRSPKWLIEASRTLFNRMWASYDGFFKDLFGDGERTMEPDEQLIFPYNNRA